MSKDRQRTNEGSCCCWWCWRSRRLCTDLIWSGAFHLNVPIDEQSLPPKIEISSPAHLWPYYYDHLSTTLCHRPIVNFITTVITSRWWPASKHRPHRSTLFSLSLFVPAVVCRYGRYQLLPGCVKTPAATCVKHHSPVSWQWWLVRQVMDPAQ